MKSCSYLLVFALISQQISGYQSNEITSIDHFTYAHHNLSVSYGSCNLSSECFQYPYYVCENNLCYHKNVFPSKGLEWVGYVLVAVLMGLCNVAGIGGGAID